MDSLEWWVELYCNLQTMTINNNDLVACPWHPCRWYVSVCASCHMTIGFIDHSCGACGASTVDIDWTAGALDFSEGLSAWHLAVNMHTSCLRSSVVTLGQPVEEVKVEMFQCQTGEPTIYGNHGLAPENCISQKGICWWTILLKWTKTNHSSPIPSQACYRPVGCNCLTSPRLSLCHVSDYSVSMWERGWHDAMVIIYQWIEMRAIGWCF